jgi:histidinol dehydrogenase
MLKIKKLNSTEANFSADLQKALSWESLASPQILASVQDILQQVRETGDQAVLTLTERFDRLSADSVADLEIPQSSLQQSLQNIPQEQAKALREAAERIRFYHQKQKQDSWRYEDEQGSVYGQKITPLDRVGIYIPGGKASYPSTVLMDAIPARVAGVPEIIAMVPTPGGEANELVLAALALAGVDRVFRIGGAQAIAALAYGTQSIPKVDKIVGPGNIYVALAKQQVFGQVGIDMVAGPSEILVICDAQTNPDWVAMDLFSQAEHDEDAQSILVCPDDDYIEAVRNSMEKLLQTMERAKIIQASLENRGLLIKVKSLQEAAEVSNRIAPEHLELSMQNPESLLDQIKHAGAIFLGPYTSEALGDYCAGPSHVLPTSGTARFSSALGVYDFQKRSSIIQCSAETASQLGGAASILARSEGLTAHARSAEYRKMKGD